MSKVFILKHQADPGHGWVGIKLKLAQELGILDKVSHYSFLKGKTIYLEEDGDLSLLCNAIKARGDTYSFKNSHTDNRHPIRYYKSATQENIAKFLAAI